MRGTGDNLRSGGRVLVDQLRLHGADMAFGVPGESYLAVLDAMFDVPELRYVICRQEGGAAMMADAHARLTGRPGIVFVTRGPGATNASAGVHIACQDSVPLILFIGQVGRGMIEREAFQEIDYRRMFGQMAKWVAQIDDAARIPEYVHRAFMTATSGRPGPVVLALPEDMLRDMTDTGDARPYHAAEAHPGAADMERLRSMLAEAKKPLMIIGGGGWNAEACADIRAFAEANSVPLAVSFRCQDYADHTATCYAGDLGLGISPKLAQRVKDSDLLIVIGARLGEMTTGGYTLLAPPVLSQRLVHILSGAEELGRVFQPDLAIHAGPKAMAAALKAMQPVGSAAWAGEMEAAHAAHLAHARPPRITGDVQMGEIVTWLGQNLPADAIMTNGAGNYTAWLNRFHTHRHYRSLLAPTSGSMGYGLPAAVAAKISHPERTVICYAGDGCFLMHGQEFATAVQHDAAIIVLLINNAMYGTIRMHQEREYPARISGTDLVNPDFAALARAYGGFGATVTRTDEFAPAFEAARASGKPALIEILIDPEAITPTATLSGLREKALAEG